MQAIWSAIKSLFNYLLEIPSRLIAVVFILLIIISSLIGYKAYTNFQNKVAGLILKLQTYEKGKQIGPGTVVSNLETVSKKVFNEKLKELSSKDQEIDKLTKELKSKKREIVSRTETKIKIVEKIIYVNKSSDTIEDKVHLKKIVNDKKLHLATVSFNTKDLKNPWSYEVHELKLKLQVFHSVNKNKPDRVGINAKLIDKDGNEIPATILSSNTTYTYPKHKLPSWSLSISPFRLELNILGGIDFSQGAASAGFSLSSHLLKLSHGDMHVFRFLGLGVGYNSPSSLNILIHPVSFNLGIFIPFVSDLFFTIGVGPGFSFSGGTPKPGIILMFGLGTTI